MLSIGNHESVAVLHGVVMPVQEWFNTTYFTLRNLGQYVCMHAVYIIGIIQGSSIRTVGLFCSGWWLMDEDDDNNKYMSCTYPWSAISNHIYNLLCLMMSSCVGLVIAEL